MPPERIVVFGTTGSGKSTLAKAIGSRLGIPYFEMDALHWNPGWVGTPVPEFRRKVEAATQGEAWVTEGQYSQVRDIYLRRADTAVWLDYSFALVFYRLLRRTLSRIIDRKPVCNGNYETWRNAFLDRESILLYAFRGHWRKRREYPELWREYPHLQVLHFRSPHQTERWLQTLSHTPSAESALQ